MSTVAGFRKELTDMLDKRKLPVSPWRGGKRISAHLLEIGTTPSPTVLYVKESNISNPWWGLTKNHVDRLESVPIRWFAVLLRSSPRTGYVLEGDQVRLRANDGTFELSGDGDYKVHEDDLDHRQWFSNVAELLTGVL